MEVEEDNSSNNLQRSTPTALLNEASLENDTINDTELGKQELESNTQEPKVEELSVLAPKLDDPNPSGTVAVGETEAEKEVSGQVENLESDSCWNSVTNVLQHEKDGVEGAIQEIPTADVTGDGDCEEDVAMRDTGLNVVEESVRNDGVDIDTNASLVIKNDKDGGEGEMETTSMEEDAKVLKDGVEMDVLSLPVAEICEPEEVKTDLKSDDGVDTVKEDVQTVDGDDTITEVQVVNAVEESVGVDTASNALPVIKNDNDGGEGEIKTMRTEEDVKVLKDGEEVDVPLLPVADICEPKVVMRDVKGDVSVDNVKESVQTVEGDEAITEGQGVNAVEESVRNKGGDTDTNLSPVIKNDKDGGEGEIETMRVEEEVKVLKDGEEVDVPSLPVAEICVREEVMVDLKGDDSVDSVKENVQTVEGDETIIEGQGVNVELMVADEVAAAPGVGEGANEGEKMADEEKPFSVTEVDEEVQMVAVEEKKLDADLETEDEAAMADGEKVETELPESPVKNLSRTGGKRRRGGKSSNPTPKSTGRAVKKIEEDVCFICFDGGDLVLCDKRDCPKAYHPSCVNRDEAFFQTKGKWNCGWHQCSICEKKAEYMCYTCTFSLCKACIKSNVILCVRDKEKKGFCEACMKTIMLIEKNSQDNQANVDLDDNSSWEYFFKDYWTDLKAKLNLSLTDLVEAKNAWKGFEPAGKQEPLSGHSDGGSGSENTSENQESQTRKTSRRKSKQHKTRASADNATEGTTTVPENTEWASKELLEFVMHMGNDKSYKSQFDVQALLLEYIKTNKLRDTRRKSQIICDARLQSLFGKPRVGHFEMLKLLESHFLIKEDDDFQGSVLNNEVIMGDDDEAIETGKKGRKDKKRKIRKKGDREPQSNREDYAAIDIHNVNLIYVRRKLAEDLLDDTESFDSKIIGTVVRIRIPAANPKNDTYRLVQVKGTTKGAQYAVGTKMTDIMLEILNLNKREYISIDTISNQDFTEDECKRLRQSVKCGFTSRLTVGDILDKAIELQAARVNDWIETEVVRLSHLRDRASDLGRKKELRECVEKLQVLKTPEERARRLQDIPVIHDDPAMDPEHVSEEDNTDENDKKQDMYRSSVGSRFSKKPDYPSTESWRGSGASTSRNTGKSSEFSRNMSSNSFSKKVEHAALSPHFEPRNEKVREGRDRNIQPPSILKKPSSANQSEIIFASTKDVPETIPKFNETDKLWHYKDPTGKIQGPFSMAQLRKWNNSKYFPDDLRIWKKSENEDNGFLLSDALEGRFTPSVKIPKAVPDERHVFSNLPSPTPNQSSGHVGPSVYHSSNDGLLSPTPNTQLATLLVAGGNKEPNAMVQSQMVQATADQNAYGWSGGPPQNLLPSPSGNVAAQQLPTYNHWGVQNPGGNFLQPSQPNISWPTVNPNPNANTGLVGPTPVNQTMNWGTGNVNASWGLQAGQGWVSSPAAQGVTPNQGWVAGPGPGSTQGPIVSGNANPNWVGPPGNQGVLPNNGEVASPGNQGPSWVGGATIQGSGSGSSNQGWGSPRPRNRTRWDESGGYSGENRSRGSGGSGSHGNRRHWDKPGSFNNRGRSRESDQH